MLFLTTDEIADQAQNQFLSLFVKVVTPRALWNKWSSKRPDSQKKTVLFTWIREGRWRRDISTSPKQNSYVYDYPKKKIKSRKIQQLSVFIQYYIANNVGWSTIFSFHKANIIKLICNIYMYNMFCYNKIQIQKSVNSHLAIVET